MNLLQLEYFLTVAKCQHMTRAAQLLHISQPTLSQIIRNLEQDLGVSLFDRKGRNIQLNTQGKYLLERTSFILSYIEETKKELRGTAANSESTEISICIHTGHLIFLDIIQNYHNIQNKVKFNLLQNDALLPDVLNICSENLAANAANRCYLFDDEILLLVSKKSRFAPKTSIDVGELKNESFINNTTQFLKELTLPYCERAGFVPNFIYTVEKNSEIQSLIEMNYGIAFWPKTVLNSILSDQIKPLSLTRPKCIRSMFITYPEIRSLSNAEKNFVDYCRNYFQIE